MESVKGKKTWKEISECNENVCQPTDLNVKINVMDKYAPLDVQYSTNSFEREQTHFHPLIIICLQISKSIKIFLKTFIINLVQHHFLPRLAFRLLILNWTIHSKLCHGTNESAFFFYFSFQLADKNWSAK